MADKGIKRRRRLNDANRGNDINDDFESKVNDLNVFTNSGVSVNTYFQLLNGISLGDDYNTRKSDSIQMFGVDIKFWITGSISWNARFMLVYDRQANGAAMNSDSLIGDPAPVHSSTINNFVTYENRRRFVVLRDEFVMSERMYETVGPTSYFRPNYYGEWFEPLGIETIYNAGRAGTIADIITGSLYFVAMGDVAAGTNVNIRVISRLHFTDK